MSVTWAGASVDYDAGALLARLAASPSAVERVCLSLRAIDGGTYAPSAVRRALLAASAACVTSPRFDRGATVSIEYTVVCDTCSGIIAARRDRADALADARSTGAVRVGRPPRDVCAQCRGR